MASRVLTLVALFIILFPLSLLADSLYDEYPAAIDFDRRMSENYHIELMPYFGEFYGDALNNSFATGGRLQGNLIPELGIQIDGGYSRSEADGRTPLGQTLANRHTLILSGGVVSTKPAALRNRKKTVEADFFATIGGGIVRFNESYRGMGMIGGGMKTRFQKVPWLSWSIEIRDYLYSIPNPGGSDFETDLTLTVGPTFLLWAEK